MDTAAMNEQMRALYQKAKAARAEGKRTLARTFRAGGRRIERKLAIAKRQAEAAAPKKAEE